MSETMQQLLSINGSDYLEAKGKEDKAQAHSNYAGEKVDVDLLGLDEVGQRIGLLLTFAVR